MLTRKQCERPLPLTAEGPALSLEEQGFPRGVEVAPEPLPPSAHPPTSWTGSHGEQALQSCPPLPGGAWSTACMQEVCSNRLSNAWMNTLTYSCIHLSIHLLI